MIFKDGGSPSYNFNMKLGDSVLVEIDVFLTLPLSNLEFEISTPMFLQVI